MKAQQDTTFTYHKKKGITMEKKEARAQKEEADRYQKLQDDLTKCQLEEQLFKLYHNEREIDHLSDALKTHQKNLNELVSKTLTTYICRCTYSMQGFIWVGGEGGHLPLLGSGLPFLENLFYIKNFPISFSKSSSVNFYGNLDFWSLNHSGNPKG